VIFSHSYPLGTGTERFEPLFVYSDGRMTFGTLAVDCFFIISGYLISQSWKSDPRAMIFLGKRARRIYPGFLVAVLICAFVLTPVFSTQGTSLITIPFAGSFIGRALRLLDSYPGGAFQGNPAPGPMNGSLWSISYEFWCYVGLLACGLTGMLGRRFWLITAFLLSVLVSFVFERLHLTPGGKWLGAIFGYPPFWARLLPFFLIGMVFHAYRSQIHFRSGVAFLCLASAMLGLLLPYATIFVLPIAAAYLIFWFAFKPMGPISSFAKHGDFSYGIYLYSFPILQIIVFLYGKKLSPLVLFSLSWPLAIAAGAVSWFIVERRWVVRKVVVGQTPAGYANESARRSA